MVPSSKPRAPRANQLPLAAPSVSNGARGPSFHVSSTVSLLWSYRLSAVIVHFAESTGRCTTSWFHTDCKTVLLLAAIVLSDCPAVIPVILNILVCAGVEGAAQATMDRCVRFWGCYGANEIGELKKSIGTRVDADRSSAPGSCGSGRRVCVSFIYTISFFVNIDLRSCGLRRGCT